MPYGYDSLFHLFSLVSLDQRIAAGDVYPLRFPGFAYGYGWAELSYYPPLSPYLLELLHLLGANYVIAYKLGMTLMVVGAALVELCAGRGDLQSLRRPRDRHRLCLQPVFSIAPFSPRSSR